MSQAKYTRNSLGKAKMEDYTPISTLLAVKNTSSPNDNQLVNASEYRAIVGSLQYLTFSHPDITYAVNRVCQQFQNPTKADLKAVKCILRYLKGTLDYRLRFFS